MAGSPIRLAGILVFAAAGALAVWLVTRARQAPAPSTPPAVEQPAAAPSTKPPAPVVAPLPIQTPVEAGIKEEDCIVYPDGTRLPPLNGVKKAPTLTFDKRLMPFAKVVRKEIDPATGIEWYIHENGVRSTTRLQPDGRAFGEVEMARPSAPVVPDK
jgi:hypothetical protein